MITTNVDLGQIILGTLIALVGFLIKNELSRINDRLDAHDERILDLIRTVARIDGLAGER